MPSRETAAHARLKTLSLAWAVGNGFPIAATEVRLPRSNFRVDVAAYRPSSGEGPPAASVFECKQARADLLKDAGPEAATREKLAELTERRAKLEELIGAHRPDVRRGESLFPEFDAIDASALRHETYSHVLAEIGRLQNRLLLHTKFDRMFRYRPADLLWIVAEDGIFAPAEIPAGWGLLVRSGDILAVRQKPVRLEPEAGALQGLLEAIARSAVKAVLRERGLGRAPGSAGETGI